MKRIGAADYKNRIERPFHDARRAANDAFEKRLIALLQRCARSSSDLAFIQRVLTTYRSGQ